MASGSGAAAHSRRFTLSPRRAALQPAVHGVGVLAPAAGPVHPVVAAPAQLQAPLGGRVTEQAG